MRARKSYYGNCTSLGRQPPTRTKPTADLQLLNSNRLPVSLAVEYYGPAENYTSTCRWRTQLSRTYAVYIRGIHTRYTYAVSNLRICTSVKPYPQIRIRGTLSTKFSTRRVLDLLLHSCTPRYMYNRVHVHAGSRRHARSIVRESTKI
jgi:hypothetical protein